MDKVKTQGMTLELLKDMEFKGVTVIKGPKPSQGPTVRPSLRLNSLNSKDIPIDRIVFDELCLMDEDCAKCREYREDEQVCAQGVPLNSMNSKDLKGRGGGLEKGLNPQGGRA